MDSDKKSPKLAGTSFILGNTEAGYGRLRSFLAS